MPRYLCYPSSLDCDITLAFNDEQSAWCDYFLEHSLNCYEADSELASSTVLPAYTADRLPAAFFLDDLGAIMRALRDDDVFERAMLAGTTPADMADLAHFLDWTGDLYGSGLDVAFRGLPVADMVALAKDPEPILRIVRLWSWTYNEDRQAGAFMPSDVKAICDIPESVLPVINDAACAGVPLSSVLVYSGAWGSAYAAWQAGVPVLDIFA